VLAPGQKVTVWRDRAAAPVAGLPVSTR